MNSREPIQYDKQITGQKPNDARSPQGYAPPTVEKMQKLAQVTGVAAATGPV